MDVRVDMTKPTKVEIGLTGLRQLAQEIRIVLATRKGSVPLDRDFGVSWDLIDKPIPAAKQMLIAEIAQQLEQDVPRIRFKSIEFFDPGNEQSVDGLMQYAVTVEIRQEYLSDFIES